jgi:hypothetical protein
MSRFPHFLDSPLTDGSEEDNIKMELRGIGWGVMDWIGLAGDRDQWRAFVNTVMNLQVP